MRDTGCEGQGPVLRVLWDARAVHGDGAEPWLGVRPPGPGGSGGTRGRGAHGVGVHMGSATLCQGFLMRWPPLGCIRVWGLLCPCWGWGWLHPMAAPSSAPAWLQQLRAR